MGNLGGYQVLTSVAKRVGGPKGLVVLLLVGGAVIHKGIVVAVNAVSKRITAERSKKRQEAEAAVLYTVHTEGRSNEGLLFKVGDTFRILETDGDAGLIEKIDDENNPYFVSLKFLSTISDYNLS